MKRLLSLALAVTALLVCIACEKKIPRSEQDEIRTYDEDAHTNTNTIESFATSEQQNKTSSSARMTTIHSITTSEQQYRTSSSTYTTTRPSVTTSKQQYRTSSSIYTTTKPSVTTTTKPKNTGPSEDEYIQQVLREAEAKFTDYTKYEAALSIILNGLQKYPNNQLLLEKKDYYQGFAPVFLSDVTPYSKSVWFKSYNRVTDVFGTAHQKCIRIEKNFEKAEGTYDLKRAYNSFSMTVFGLGDGEYGTIKIYADGVCIYSNTKIDVNTRPFNVNLDVTGVLDLKIEMYQSYKSYTGECFALSNVKVQKTAK